MIPYKAATQWAKNTKKMCNNYSVDDAPFYLKFKYPRVFFFCAKIPQNIALFLEFCPLIYSRWVCSHHHRSITNGDPILYGDLIE